MGTATYCPEDNKLRLYIGRVPREEYLKLKSEGWTTLHKQRDAGGGDFVATWTPERRNTALSYSDDGIIEDEDMGPEERAADRAERFGGYRDKRTTDAVGHADRYDEQPTAHGYQNEQRAERAAARHDRIADRACDAWDKAEYWQRRTEGVIRHALYKSSPGVRMGRIKDLESLIRCKTAEYEKAAKLYDVLVQMRDITDPEEQTQEVRRYFDHVWSHSKYPHPDDPTVVETIERLMNSEKYRQITGAEACALYFSNHTRPDVENNDWCNHYKLRLAYENQMLAAQGGMLEQFEVLVGGKLGGKLILKVNKSPATGRATSVSILGPKVHGWTYKAGNIPGTEWAEHQFDLERMEPEAYTPPTEESLAELAKIKAAIKAAAPKKPECPLINPTDEDAERLQALWNEREKAKHEAKNTWRSPESRAQHSAEFQPGKVMRITQAVYSQNSKGTYAKAETRGLCRDGELENRNSNLWTREKQERAERIGAPVCKVRITSGGKSCGWSYDCIIVITDKPQKPLPAAVWECLAKPEPPEQIKSQPKEKFWNCACGFQATTSTVYSEKLCPKCGLKMHDDTKEVAAIRHSIANQTELVMA